jgi:hypothetical protein
MQDSKRRISVDSRVYQYLAPVWSVLDAGLSRLPPGPPLNVEFGAANGFATLDGERLLLSEKLDGPDIYHPGEQLVLLDRWRRGAACILEATAMLSLAQTVDRPPCPNWKWVGAAIHLADAVAPDLGLAKSSLVIAIRTGNPGRYPRGGLAVYRSWEAAGEDVWQRIHYVLEGGIISAEEWLEVGLWVFDLERGAPSLFSIPVERPGHVDVPVKLEPWSWKLICVPAHERGGRILVEGDGAVQDPWGVAGRELRTVVAAANRGCALNPSTGGPVGSWQVSSVQGFGQIMGARGVDFHFNASGRLQIVLADAFVGPLAVLAMAEQMGTSGTVSGKWAVGGAQQLVFDQIKSTAVTMHGRDLDPFAMPANGFGLSEWIRALTESHWWWEINSARMVMRGKLMGEMIEIRFKETE